MTYPRKYFTAEYACRKNKKTRLRPCFLDTSSIFPVKHNGYAERSYALYLRMEATYSAAVSALRAAMPLIVNS